MNSNELIEIQNIEDDAIKEIEEEKENENEEEKENENEEEKEIELSDDKKREIKKAQITALATAYYKRFSFLHDKSISEFINGMLDDYLDTDLTIEEINEEFMNKIINLIETEGLERKKENSGGGKSDDDEMESMFQEQPEENVIDNSMEFEKPKIYVKTDNNENGFIHYRQLILPYAVLVIMVILIEIFNFIS